jgi:hypothetical protein
MLTLQSISPYSGHYRPSEDSFKSFLSFLNDNGVNLDEVQVITFVLCTLKNIQLKSPCKGDLVMILVIIFAMGL